MASHKYIRVGAFVARYSDASYPQVIHNSFARLFYLC